MFEAFRVAAVVNLSIKGMAGLTALSAQMAKSGQAAAALQARMTQIRNLAMGGALVGGVGVMGFVGLVRMANAAGDLSMALRSVQIAGGYTDTQMKMLQKTVFQVSDITARSAAEVADWMRLVATGSTFTAQQLAKIMPTVAKFADIMYFTKRTPFEESIQIGVRFAHLFGQYSPEELERGLSQVAAASMVISGGPQQLMTSLSQFAQTARVLRVAPAEQVAFAAFLNRLGMESRGGTSLMNMLLYGLPGSVMLTGSRSRARLEAGVALGMFRPGPGGAPIPTWMQGGQASLVTMTKQLIDAYKKATVGKTGDALTLAISQFTAELQKLFNLRGMRGAAVMATIPQAMAQIETIMNKVLTDLSVAEKQAIVAKEWNYQMSRMTTNFQNILLNIMLPFVQGTGPITLKNLGDAFARISDSITPEKANAILAFAAGFSALMVTIGGLLLFKAAVLAVAFLLTPAGALGLAIVALGAAAIALALNWDKVTDMFARMKERWHDFIFGIEEWLRRLGLIKPPEAQSVTPPAGYMTVWGLSGGIAGYQKVVGGVGTGPLLSQEQIRAMQAMPSKASGGYIAQSGPYFLHRGEHVARAGEGAGIHIGAITITQLPGEDSEAFLNRLLRRFDEKVRDAARGSGQGVLHPMIPAHGY